MESAAGAVRLAGYLQAKAATMFRSFPEPQHTPCPECGVSVARSEASEHVCEREQWLDYQVFQRREELEALSAEVGAYLASPQGKFGLWYAERERRRATRRKRSRA
jgi:hypothetical protein